MTAASLTAPPSQTVQKPAHTVLSFRPDGVASSSISTSTKPLISSHSPSPARAIKARHEAGSVDFLSDKATASLIRKVLVADSGHGTDARASPGPVQDILPPLTSSNEVDRQLYAIVAIIVKDAVNSWYAKITPDHAFVDEVIQILAHCSRAVEQRLRQLDMTELILDELPILVERHVLAYRTATTAQAALQYGESPQRIYHALNPHPALPTSTPSDEQQADESAYRQLLVQGALAVLLPTEDLANGCLRTLVSDIIADLILGNALGQRVCEAWFLYDAISNLVATATSRPHPPAAEQKKRLDRRSRLEKFGLLTSESQDEKVHSSGHHQSPISVWFWRVLQCGYIAYQFFRFILVGLSHARQLPNRGRSREAVPPRTVSKQSSDSLHVVPVAADDRSPRSVLTYTIFSCVSTTLDLSIRMPWLGSTLSFWQHVLSSGPGRLGGPDSILDKFLHYTLDTRVFSPSLLPPLLLNVRAILFPGNAMGPPPPPPPSAEEVLKIRRQAARDILSLVPVPISRTFFSTDDHEEMVAQVEETILDVFGDAYMNKHLIYGILELLMVRLAPEMLEKTPMELLAERGLVFEIGAEGKGV